MNAALAAEVIALVPQRLKPRIFGAPYGTAEAVPLSKAFALTARTGCASCNDRLTRSDYIERALTRRGTENLGRCPQADIGRAFPPQPSALVVHRFMLSED
jgi:hypothetical protein